MADAKIVEQLRDELGKARVLADPKNYEEVLQLRAEVIQLKAKEAEYESLVEKLTLEKDVAKSSLAALQAKHAAEETDQRRTCEELRERFQQDELKAARSKVSQLDAVRELNVQRKVARESRAKVITLECRLEILLEEKIGNIIPEQKILDVVVQPTKTTDQTFKAPKQATPTNKQNKLAVAELKTKAQLLSPAYESKAHPRHQAMQQNRRSVSSVSSKRSEATAGNKKIKRDLSDEEEDDSEDDTARRSLGSRPSSSKKKTKPRYSLNKAKPEQNAFAAFDLTKRMAAPKLKSN